MDNRPAVISPNVWIALVVLLAVGVGVVAVLRIDRAGDAGSGLPERFEYGIEQYEKIDPALIEYELTHEFPTGMAAARAIAVGPEDRIYAAGEEGVYVFAPSGTREASIAMSGRPTCLAVGGAEHAAPGRVYVGVGRYVLLKEVFLAKNAEGSPAATWEIFGKVGKAGKKVHLTSIALARDDVFVADSANRIVLRYDTLGKLVGRIGEHDKERGVAGFAIPSPFFDVAVAPDGLLWVVNPGALRLEAYTFEGTLQRYWGEEGAAVEAFFGCCNPAHFAILPDGRFVTAEKGLLRVKVYSADGHLDCAVAGPEQLDSPAEPGGQGQFDEELTAVDVAADSQGRILVLDVAGRNVQIYERKRPVTQESEADAEPT